jgi:medium-chain acyl-[acyl-carrier-protein] hydrolase
MNVADSAGRWLLMHRPRREARVRLLCLPYAGGGASAFRHWPDALTSSIEVCPVQLPGRENRFVEAPFTRAEAVVEAMAPALRPVLDRPYALFGHSMGAMLGFELIRHLRRRGDPLPVQFFVSAARAPQLPRPGAPIHALPDAAFVERLRGLQGTPEGILQDKELLQFVLPALRADFTVVETYRYTPGERLDCLLTAFGGRSDGAVSFAELAGWSDQARRDFRLQMLPGNHFFLHDPAARQTLTQTIERQLAPYLAHRTPFPAFTAGAQAAGPVAGPTGARHVVAEPAW